MLLRFSPLLIGLLLIAAAPLRAQSTTWYPLDSLPWGDAQITALETDSLGGIYAVVYSRTTQVDQFTTVPIAVLWRSLDRGTTWEKLVDGLVPGFLTADGGNGILFGYYYFGVNEYSYATLRRPHEGRTLGFGGIRTVASWNRHGTVALGLSYTQYVDDMFSDAAIINDDTVTLLTRFEHSYAPNPHVTATAVMESGTVVAGFQEAFYHLGEPPYHRSGIYRVTAGDTAWVLIDTLHVPALLYATSSDALLASNDTCIMRSTDTGATWHAVDSAHWIQGFATDTRGAIYAFGPRFTLRSHDSGVSWKQIETSGPRIWNARDGALWTLLNGVPHRSIYQGFYWMPFSAGLPEGTTTRIAVGADGSIYAAGKGGVGLYRLEEQRVGGVEKREEHDKLDLR